MDVFQLDSIVNALYMDKNFTNGNRIHTNRVSHGFVYMRDGHTTYEFQGGKTVITETGCFMYLPKDSTYCVTSKYRGEVYCINLLCDDNVFGGGDPNSKGFSLPLKRTHEVESIYKKVIRQMYLKKPFYELTVKSLVYELCAIILSERNLEYLPSNSRARLEPAMSYINDHYTENDIKVPFLAELCDMSENYFRRLFSQIFGMSPIKYINERRISYASEFLKSGLYSVSEVASIVGFEDIGYFSRTYKKIAGEIPSVTKNNK